MMPDEEMDKSLNTSDVQKILSNRKRSAYDSKYIEEKMLKENPSLAENDQDLALELFREILSKKDQVQIDCCETSKLETLTQIIQRTNNKEVLVEMLEFVESTFEVEEFRFGSQLLSRCLERFEPHQTKLVSWGLTACTEQLEAIRQVGGEDKFSEAVEVFIEEISSPLLSNSDADCFRNLTAKVIFKLFGNLNNFRKIQNYEKWSNTAISSIVQNVSWNVVKLDSTKIGFSTLSFAVFLSVGLSQSLIEIPMIYSQFYIFIKIAVTASTILLKNKDIGVNLGLALNEKARPQKPSRYPDSELMDFLIDSNHEEFVSNIGNIICTHPDENIKRRALNALSFFLDTLPTSIFLDFMTCYLKLFDENQSLKSFLITKLKDFTIKEVENGDGAKLKDIWSNIFKLKNRTKTNVVEYFSEISAAIGALYTMSLRNNCKAIVESHKNSFIGEVKEALTSTKAFIGDTKETLDPQQIELAKNSITMLEMNIALFQ